MKASSPCFGCQPSRKNLCENPFQPSPTSPVQPSPTPPAQLSPSPPVQPSSSGPDVFLSPSGPSAQEDAGCSVSTDAVRNPPFFDHVTDANSMILPSFSPLPAAPIFTWGDVDGASFSHQIDEAYQVIVHWRRNIFKVPQGKTGKDFIYELSKFFKEYANDTMLESVALKAAMVMPALLLQRPHLSSKPKENAKCVERRLGLWRGGNITELINEGRSIQFRLSPLRINKNSDDGKKAFTFAQMMRNGNVSSALRQLSDVHKGGPLSPDMPCGDQESVRDVLLSKHPPGKQIDPSAIVDPDPSQDSFHPVIFDSLTGALIKSVALQMSGAAGPSLADARDWRRFCCSFN